MFLAHWSDFSTKFNEEYLNLGLPRIIKDLRVNKKLIVNWLPEVHFLIEKKQSFGD